MLRQQLEILNHKKYKGEEESRLDIFLRAELGCLRDLPESHYEHTKVKIAKVQRNYHIQLDSKHHYSVPFKYAGQRVKVYFNQRRWKYITKMSVLFSCTPKHRFSVQYH